MAKRKAERKTTQTGSVASRIQGGIRNLQRELAAPLARARNEALRLLREQQRALSRVIRDAQGVRRDVERRAQQTSKDLERRSRRLLSRLEKETAKRLETVVKRLAGRDLASRREVQGLARRIQALEQLMRRNAHVFAARNREPSSEA
jgi:hypothetical protein